MRKRSQTRPKQIRLPMPIEVKERYLEVREVETHRAIAAIEVLSPKNKRKGDGPTASERKRNRVLGSSSHLVEIDLLRENTPMRHISQDLKVPEGLHLTLLPSHSPELQPAERLWTLVDEPIANQSFETLGDLEEVLFHRCKSLLQQQDLIRGLTGFHWWTVIGA